MSDVNDRATYRALSVPHATREECEAAMRAFADEVEAARKKHKILEVYIVMESPALHEDADGKFEGDVTVRLHVGRTDNACMLLAKASAAEEASRDTRLARARSKRKDDHA